MCKGVKGNTVDHASVLLTSHNPSVAERIYFTVLLLLQLVWL